MMAIEGAIFEDTRFTRNIRKYRFKNKSVFKFPQFWIWKMLHICIFAYNFANAGTGNEA